MPAPYAVYDLPRMTEEEYLEFEAESETKHEYFDGHVTGMAGASDPHELVAMNLAAALHAHLRGKGCRVYKSDMKLRLNVAAKKTYYYPDVMVVCDPKDNHRIYKERPKLIIEIMSENWKRDFIEKYHAYQNIASLEEYVLVSSDAEAPEVTIMRRAESWDQGRSQIAGAFELVSVGLKLTVEELYLV